MLIRDGNLKGVPSISFDSWIKKRKFPIRLLIGTNDNRAAIGIVRFYFMIEARAGCSLPLPPSFSAANIKLNSLFSSLTSRSSWRLHMFWSKDCFVLSFFAFVVTSRRSPVFFFKKRNRKKEKKNLSSLTIMLILCLPASTWTLSLVSTVALTTLTHLLWFISFFIRWVCWGALLKLRDYFSFVGTWQQDL